MAHAHHDHAADGQEHGGHNHAGHGHGGHSHGGHHHHGPPPTARPSRAFAIAVTLNLAFTIAETIAGLASGSLALVADAGHNFSDVLSLLLAWGASVLVERPPSARFTYGMKSSSILAAIANASLLWVALGAILLETIRRFFHPEPVQAGTMIWVATLGIVINAASAWLFARGSKSDLNLRAAFQHLMADAAVSAGVVVAGFGVMAFGASWIDPLTSLLITGVIAWGSWGLMRESVKMGLLAVPEQIDENAVRQFLEARPGVTAVHDLHIWPMSTTETAITAHLTMPTGYPGDGFLHTLATDLEHDFEIGHPTFQIETLSDAPCALHSETVV
jgi:cobalt-zinc-cadmium efflux system protein